jgi:hypothetical protein
MRRMNLEDYTGRPHLLQTRRGDQVTRVIRTGHPGYPFNVWHKRDNGVECLLSYTEKGTYWRSPLRSSELDILPITTPTILKVQEGAEMNKLMLNLQDDKKFVVIDTRNNQYLGNHRTLEDAIKAARKALKQESEYYIFEAVRRVAPKAIEADIEEL